MRIKREEKLMLINALDPGELRVAILRDGELDELYVETGPSHPVAGDIYKGRVSRYEPSLEAAFVDIGTGKHGFLHVSDVFLGISKRPSVQKAREFLQSGRELLVQITKEGLGEKGPALTMRLSLPGRYLVLMPSLGRIGVSRRIADPALRETLKEKLAMLRPLEGMGFVIRTEAKDVATEELKRDAEDLLEHWQAMIERARASPAPALIRAEEDLVLRALRDYLTSDISEIWVDSQEAFRRAQEYVARFAPSFEGALRLYDSPEPLFHHFGVEGEMRRLLGSREVRLPGGGWIVIEQTEAMVAIDVNSGRTKRRKGSAATLLQTNLQAAREIARQLRLRDLGGLIVIDFIDMDDPEERRMVEEELRRAVKSDKARTTILPISELGLLEMTRQRRRETLERRMTERCHWCGGRGVVRSLEGLALDVLRELRSALGRSASKQLEVLVHPERVVPLRERLCTELAELMSERQVQLTIRPETGLPFDSFTILQVKP